MSDVRFVVFHLPGAQWRAGASVFEQPGIAAHVAHWRGLRDAGKLALGGPHPDARGGGMMIAAAGVTADELARFATADPAVQAGVLAFEVRPWRIGLRGDAAAPA